MKVQCWVYFPPKEENLIHQDYEHDWKPTVGMHGCLEWKGKWKALSHCPTLCSTMDHSPPGSSVHGILQARILELGSHSFLQGIFPIQGWNLGLLHCGQILCHLSRQGSPRILERVASPFSRGSSWLTGLLHYRRVLYLLSYHGLSLIGSHPCCALTWTDSLIWA